MLTQTILAELSEHLSKALKQPITIDNAFAVSGGDINTSYRLQSNAGDFFVKTQFAPRAKAMFEAEWAGLTALRQCGAFKVPQPIAIGAVGERHFLLMEALDLQDTGDEASLGRALAELHRINPSHYGWGTENFIGNNMQFNTPSNNWQEFWWDCRLKPQLERARARGYGAQLCPREAALKAASDALLEDHNPTPSLVHGDLWRGNVGFCGTRPCVFDPACYWGDREVDVAMTQLFGGFSRTFYQAYNRALPLADGYEQRVPLYNLYHLLNHLNIFGGSYLRQCIRAIESLTVKAAKYA